MGNSLPEFYSVWTLSRKTAVAFTLSSFFYFFILAPFMPSIVFPAAGALLEVIILAALIFPRHRFLQPLLVIKGFEAVTIFAFSFIAMWVITEKRPRPYSSKEVQDLIIYGTVILGVNFFHIGQTWFLGLYVEFLSRSRCQYLSKHSQPRTIEPFQETYVIPAYRQSMALMHQQLQMQIQRQQALERQHLHTRQKQLLAPSTVKPLVPESPLGLKPPLESPSASKPLPESSPGSKSLSESTPAPKPPTESPSALQPVPKPPSAPEPLSESPPPNSQLPTLSPEPGPQSNLQSLAQERQSLLPSTSGQQSTPPPLDAQSSSQPSQQQQQTQPETLKQQSITTLDSQKSQQQHPAAIILEQNGSQVPATSLPPEKQAEVPAVTAATTTTTDKHSQPSPISLPHPPQVNAGVLAAHSSQKALPQERVSISPATATTTSETPVQEQTLPPASVEKAQSLPP